MSNRGAIVCSCLQWLAVDVNKRLPTTANHCQPLQTTAPPPISAGIITISDRASAGIYEDHGGPALKKAAADYGWKVIAEAVVPDDIGKIQQAIRSFSAQGCGLILTTGGTGIAERDVTPEAIRGIARVEIPGFGEVMRAKSLAITPNAMISRCLGAIVDTSLVLALPGKPSGAVECLGFVVGAIPHSVKLALKVPTSC